MILFLKSINELPEYGDSTNCGSLASKGSFILPSPTSPHISAMPPTIAKKASWRVVYFALPLPAFITFSAKFSGADDQLKYSALQVLVRSAERLLMYVF